MGGGFTRSAAEDFLFHEAELLDDWHLPQWAALFTEDALYEIAGLASADPIASNAATELFLVADRIDRIRARATRLMKRTAHAEFPRSKTRHCFSNVRVAASDEASAALRVNFITYRTKDDDTTVYVGESRYVLALDGAAPAIRHKRVILDLDSLYAQGRLTIIL